MSVLEIRIHGVSGTPPDTMLATDPRLIEERQDGQIQVFSPTPVNPDIRAYSWSSLTSGTVTSALWLVLLPFMLCNLAGFALPRLSPRRMRLAVTIVRLAGIALTGVFSLVTAQGFVDVGAYQYLHWRMRWLGPSQSVALGALTAAGVILLAWARLSRRGTGAVTEEVDPVGRHTLGDRAIWGRHRVEEDLRLLHLAVALMAIEWVGVDALGQLGSSVPPVLRGLAVAIPVGLLVTAALVAGGRPVATILRPAVYATATLLVITAVVATADEVAPGPGPTDLTLRGHPISWTVAAFATLTLMLLVTNLLGSDKRNAVTAPALLTIAGASGASVGAALIQVSANATSGIPPGWIENLAAGYLTGILAILMVALAMAFGLAAPPSGAASRLWTTVRRMRDHLGNVLWAVVLTTLVLTVGFVGGRFGWWEFSVPAVIPISLAAIDLALLTAWLFRLGSIRGAVLALVGSLATAWAASRGFLDRDGALGWSFDGYEPTATTLTILLPLGLIAGRVLGALRHTDQRKGLAVAWDVGSFFPRWHHPFAPPSYGAAAVTDLADFIAREAEGDSRVIIAPHSQGSVIAVAALALMGGPRPDLGLLTFGSPLGSLYRRFFPAWFEDLCGVDRGLGERWVNLFRSDDPIGGPIGGAMDWPPLEDPAGRIHSGYWLEQPFSAALAGISNRLEDGR